MKKGLILLNLGTPENPEPDAVGRYLKEFLMDRWVVDIPFLFRWILVNILIVPKRKFASSHAYKTIWTDKGSPLLSNLRALQTEVKKHTTDEVAIAMRYGTPSIRAALQELTLKQVDEITVVPLYPQYAESSTRSSIEECERIAKELRIKAKLHFVRDFFQDAEFIKPVADKIRVRAENTPFDHLVMSFHGLPERHVKRIDPEGCLKSADCCAQITPANRLCYRAQSFATARAIAKELSLRDTDWSVAFQSRLGRTPWIQPFTDFTLPRLALEGVERVTVVCPSFTADCLETIEEIGDRGRALFTDAGGKSFDWVHCLNADPEWAKGVVAIAARATSIN